MAGTAAGLHPVQLFAGNGLHSVSKEHPEETVSRFFSST